MAPSTVQSGTSSTFNASVNLAKYCIGAGILALPHATQRGGLAFSPFMIGVIAAWNWLASSLLMECKRATAKVAFPVNISSNYSRIAYAGAGNIGLAITDFSIITTLLGVCIAFQITFATLMRDVPGNTLSTTALTCISGLVVYPMSCLRDLDSISSLSLLGMVCLVAGVAAILAHGFQAYGDATWREYFGETDLSSAPPDMVPLWPSSLQGAASFLGVTIFCFDICSLAFPIEDSMRHKGDFSKAVVWAMVCVWAVYVVLGDLGAVLYAHDTGRGIRENILSNLPVSSTVSLLVGLLTYPITLAPAAQMVEHQLTALCSTRHMRGYSAISERDVSSSPHSSHGAVAVGHSAAVTESAAVHAGHASLPLRLANRLGMVAFTTFVAAAVPCFGMVIGLLGGFTIAILDFVLPPLLHLRILHHRAHAALPQCEGDAGEAGAEEGGGTEGHIELRAKGEGYRGAADAGSEVDKDQQGRSREEAAIVAGWGGGGRLYRMDCALLAVGSVVCVGTTTMALMQIYQQVLEGQSC